MNKAELIQAIRSGRAELEALWAGASAEQMTQLPGPQADWSVKDLIAHLTYWEQKVARAIQSGKWSQSPQSATVNGVNAEVYQENRDRPLADVLADFHRSLEQVVGQVQALSEDDLADPGRFAWQKDRPLWDYIAGETIEHYQDHVGDLRAWRAQIDAVQQR